MAFDPELTECFRSALADHEGISEIRMIGAADKAKDGTRRFMFRVGKANAVVAAKLGATAPLQLGDRIMPGFYFVDAELCDRQNFAAWVDLAVS